MGELFTDLKNKIAETNNFNFINPWNNQLDKMKEGNAYAIHNPSCFIELETVDMHQLLKKYQGYDINVNIHIVSEELDAADGTMDSHLSVFELRDIIIKTLALYKPPQGGYLVKKYEIQDYTHTNVYHYIISYVFHYIDDTAVQPLMVITGSTLATTIKITK